MNKYAVVTFAAEEEQGKTVNTLRSLDPSAYEHYGARGVYFARFSGTAQQLAEKLGFAADFGATPGIVIGISGQYYGYGNRSLWQWLGDT